MLIAKALPVHIRNHEYFVLFQIIMHAHHRNGFIQHVDIAVADHQQAQQQHNDQRKNQRPEANFVTKYVNRLNAPAACGAHDFKQTFFLMKCFFGIGFSIAAYALRSGLRLLTDARFCLRGRLALSGRLFAHTKRNLILGAEKLLVQIAFNWRGGFGRFFGFRLRFLFRLCRFIGRSYVDQNIRFGGMLRGVPTFILRFLHTLSPNYNNIYFIL